MGATQTRLSGQPLWQAYRDAFREFATQANTLVEVKAKSSLNPAEAENALLRVEHARLAYNDVRDKLAASVMSPQLRAPFWAIPAKAVRDDSRVKSIAELLWELGGRPQGTADDDWYRAERVVRGAGAEVCCAS